VSSFRKYKIPNYQNGFAYLTSHRACYVDNDEPRKYSVAVELKDVDRIEPYVRRTPRQLSRPHIADVPSTDRLPEIIAQDYTLSQTH
jgi:hypothetical protein